MTYLHAAVTILTHADRPLTIAELTAVAVANGLVHPRGRTPDRSMSSVLYRRLATDPDSPVTALEGRFWLRGRPLPEQTVAALRPAVRRTRRPAAGSHTLRTRSDTSRTATPLPDPLPLAMPLDAVPGVAVLLSTGRRERSMASLAGRLRRFIPAHMPVSSQMENWEADRTFRMLVAPLLTLLGYRRDAQQPVTAPRDRLSRRLDGGGREEILLDVIRAGHTLGDADARSTLVRAASMSIRWAVLTNGHEVRLYTPAITGALQDPAGALVLRVDVQTGEHERNAQLLWLLTRSAVTAGALDAYLASRAVGAVLLSALDNAESALVAALTEAMQAITGLQLPPTLVARHARLAVREERGRDGEPLPGDIAAVAAIVEAPRAAGTGKPARLAS